MTRLDNLVLGASLVSSVPLCLRNLSPSFAITLNPSTKYFFPTGHGGRARAAAPTVNTLIVVDVH